MCPGRRKHNRTNKLRRITTIVAIGLVAALAVCAMGDAPGKSPVRKKAKTAMVQKKTAAPAEKKYESDMVRFKTSAGDFTVRLYDDTPLHRANFLKLVDEGFYDGVLFHRVIKDFMVQTGDPESKDAAPDKMLGAGDLGYTIEAEIRYPAHYHKYGALAAARTADQFNPERRSSGSQFYIVTGKKYTDRQLDMMSMRQADAARQSYFRGLCDRNADSIRSLQASHDTVGLEALRQDLIRQTEAAVPASAMPADMRRGYAEVGGTPHLDGQYTVFGEVVEGMETIEKIQNVETGEADRPREDVRIISARILDPQKK